MPKQPPHAPGLPWIGIARDFLQNPLDSMTHLATLDDELVEFTFFGSKAFMVNSPELLRELLVTKARQFRKSDDEVERMGRFMGKGLVTNNDPAHHMRQRKLVQPAFHHRRIAAYAEVMVDYTAEMLNEWPVNGRLDISEAMRNLTMYIVAKTLFDADRADLSSEATHIGEAIDSFQHTSEADFGLPITLPEWLPTPRNRAFRAAKQTVNDILRRIIEERRASGQDRGDLLSMLLMAQDEDGSGMDDQQLLDEAITLFVAGHETTSNALLWTWYLLAQHPDIEAKLHEELDGVLNGRLPTLNDLPNLPYTLMIIKESMRLYPPVYSLNGRVANEDVMLGNYLIPKNSYLVISQWALHRDPRIFADPLRFDPERFSPENEPAIPKYAYLPFGAGPRVCIGNSFAMMEAHLIIATIAQRFRLSLPPETAVTLNPQITLTVANGLPMQVTTRQNSLTPKQTVPLAL